VPAYGQIFDIPTLIVIGVTIFVLFRLRSCSAPGRARAHA
jgi:hypothetical protein